MGPVNIVNTALCVIILLLGYWGYKQKNQKAPLIIGVAFAFFGISHILTMIGLGATDLLITIRVIAYLLVVVGLWIFVAKE